jgi:hypothetical protein
LIWRHHHGREGFPMRILPLQKNCINHRQLDGDRQLINKPR